ncbi:MAG: cysteine desulfurase [bacterium]|nr:cysteine desulfurase [Candidatus Sumerlaeota bacterium]
MSAGLTPAATPSGADRIVPVRSFDVEAIRRDFPILASTVNGKPLVYLDNAATSQKPRPVIETIMRYYAAENANIHRGVHWLSELATAKHEAARVKVQHFINAAAAREIIFVRGATEAINLVAQSWGRANLRPGDEILVTGMEHHSNIVPWQIVCEATGAILRAAPFSDRGQLLLGEFDRMLTGKTRLVAVTHVSNALGTINPVHRIVQAAHDRGALALIDGCQAIPHMPVDVRELDCDFYVFSGHKVFGPTGIGALYGKEKLLDAMPPYQGGGDMIKSVSFEKTTYNDLPYKFEAGTPHIAGAIGLGAALDYIQDIGMRRINEYENQLLTRATNAISEIPGVRIIGTPPCKASLISFVIDGIHPHDIGTILDQEGIAIRTGHHCAQPVMERLGVPATARASFAFYNTHQEADALVRAIRKVIEVFN